MQLRRGECFCPRLWRSEVEKFCKCTRGKYIPRLAVADDLDADLITHGSAESALDEVLIHPVIKIAHPVACQSAAANMKVDDVVLLPESTGGLVGHRLGDAGRRERVHAAVAVRSHVLVVRSVLVETTVVSGESRHFAVDRGRQSVRFL